MEREKLEQNENKMDYQEFEKFNNVAGITVNTTTTHTHTRD
jgi:hypothetical protein